MVRSRHLWWGCAVLLLAACSSADQNEKDAADDHDTCMPDDQDGVFGGNNTVKLYVSDTGYAVGTADSGQRNIAIQNTSNVKLTISNVGSKPHGFHVACRPTDLPAVCPQTSCFPDASNVPALDPGASVTVMFATPAVEGEYPFTSDEPGDEALIGQFVLL
jgi:hypothetical protein